MATEYDTGPFGQKFTPSPFSTDGERARWERAATDRHDAFLAQQRQDAQDKAALMERVIRGLHEDGTVAAYLGAQNGQGSAQPAGPETSPIPTAENRMAPPPMSVIQPPQL